MIDNPASSSTVTSMSVDRRLEEVGVATIWTFERWGRVAATKGVKPYELASCFGIPHRPISHLEAAAKRGDTVRLPVPIAMLMACAEYIIMRQYTKDLILNLVGSPPEKISGDVEEL